MKLVGIAMIVACTAGLGLLRACRMSARVAELEGCLSFLDSLEEELRYTRAPIGRIAASLAGREEYARLPLAREWARGCQEGKPSWEAFQRAVESRDSSLAPGDRQTVAPLAQVLGCTDLEGQLSAIRLVSTLLGRRLEEATRQKDSRARMDISLGVLAGAAAAVLLW